MQENSESGQTSSVSQIPSDDMSPDVRDGEELSRSTNSARADTHSEDQMGQAANLWRSPRAIAIVGGLLALALVGGSVGLLSLRADPGGTGTPATVGPTIAPQQTAPSPAPATPAFLTPDGSPVPTEPPPLNNVIFPTQAINYPSDWPADLRLPSQIVPLATEVNASTDGKTRVWSAIFHLRGSREQASDLLVTFFQARGYQVRQRESANGSVLLTFERPDGTAGGSVLYDRDPAVPDTLRLLLTGRMP